MSASPHTASRPAPQVRPAEVRRDPRYDTRFRVQFDSVKAFVEEYAANISAGGVFLVTDHQLARQSIISLQIELPDGGAPLQTRAIVVHVTPPESTGRRGFGVQFIDPPAHFRERLDRYIEGEILQRHKSGAVVLVARNGRIAWEKAYGLADVASGRPMRMDAMFRLMSMTKPVTSVALLTLYEQGKFQLTDALAEHLPQFRDVKLYTGNDATGQMILKPPKRPITIQDVFRHTAGFTSGGTSKIPRSIRPIAMPASSTPSSAPSTSWRARSRACRCCTSPVSAGCTDRSTGLTNRISSTRCRTTSGTSA